jgi:hypothetical protein
MRDNNAIDILAGSIILGSAVAIGLALSDGLGPRLETAPFREAGRVLARQAIPLLKPGGSIMVITRDTVAFQNPASDALLKSFRKELTKAGGKIDSVQALQVDPLRPVAVPPGDFFQWIKKSAPGSVIVSFMGPPVLTENQIAQLGENKASIVAFCSGPVRDQVDLRSLFTHGLVQAAVVSKRPAESRVGQSGSDREAFERQFLEITPGNLAGLASSSNSSP